MRIAAVVLFVFYVNYLPAHLLAEAHLDEAVHADLHLADEAHHHDHHGDDDHLPHPESEHSLNLAAASHTKMAKTPVLALWWTDSLVLPLEQSHVEGVVAEQIKPPGESPPDPLQPRAPPLT